MALVPISCEQSSLSTEQLIRSAFLWDDVAGCPVLKTSATIAAASAPSTGTPSQVTPDTDGEVLLAAGTYPGGAIITNHSDQRVYIGVGFTPTPTNYSISLSPIDGSGNAETYIIEVGDFTGVVEASVASVITTGQVNVTALSA